MEDNGTQPVELSVRSLAPSGAREAQEATIDRLLDLERDGSRRDGLFSTMEAVG